MRNGFFTLALLLGLWCNSNVQAQTVRPVTYYPMLTWDTSPYESFRFTRENASWEWINFRLLFPNGYDSAAVDNKEYPLIIVLHGAGESGRLDWKSPVKKNHPYAADDPRRDNNDHHLLYGGREHLNAVKSGRFPGFVLFPQNSYANWAKGEGDALSDFHPDLEKAIELVEYLVGHLKVDPARIYIHGLSAGAVGTWLAAYKRPDLFAAALPMSAHGDPAMAGQLKQLPLWVFQGELDNNPRAWATLQTVNAIREAGGQVRYTEYADQGHNTWNKAYGERDFFEWMLGIRKVDTTTPNKPPIVSAGDDKTISLPDNSTTFTATASDPDGSISSYFWEKTSGPEATLSGLNSATLSLSGLTAGTYHFRLSVKDDKDAIATDEVVLVVNPAANQAPTVSAGADKAIELPLESTTFTATAADPDGTIASYVWEKVSGPEVTLSNATTATVAASKLVVGTYILKVTVTDNKGAKAWDEVQLKVEPKPNEFPTVEAGAGKTISLPTDTAVFKATASDPDGNIVSYLWEKTSGPEARMSGVSTPSLSLSGLTEGSYTFKVTVEDNAGGTASDQVSLVVGAAPNKVPVVNAGADKTLTLPDNSTTFTATASDADGTIVAYSWKQESGPEASLSGKSSATLSVSGLKEGSYKFSLLVEDNDGAKASDEVLLVVNPAPNQAPTVNAGTNKTVSLPTGPVTFTATASDPDGTIGSYLWEKVSGPEATLSGKGSATLTVGALVEGNYKFRVLVKDNEGAEASDEVELVVTSPANQAPTVTAGPDLEITLPTATASITATGTDPDGRIASWLWEKVSGPGLKLDNTTTSRVSISNLVEGTYLLRVRATDDKGAQASDQVQLIVHPKPNEAPRVNAGTDKTITLPAASLTFTATASDPDGTISSYLWEQLNGPKVTLTGAASAKLSVSEMVAGNYTFAVTVADINGATATDSVNLTVLPKPNEQPVVSAGDEQSITLPANTASFTATASDPDGNIATYFWEKVSGPMVKLSGTTVPTLTLSDLMAGTYKFRITVKDNMGDSATDVANLIVHPRPNTGPSVNAGTDKTITLPANSTTFTAMASDPDGTVSAYLWEKISGPAVTLLDNENEVLTLNGLVAGNYIFKVTVTDNNGAQAADEVTLTVQPELNKAPTVNAGDDITLTMPDNDISLTARATDEDGTIATWLWEKVNGPAASMNGQNSATLSLSGLMHGSYTFKVTVTDDKGSASSDEVIVRVFETTQANMAPVANAGADTTVYLPVDYIVLNGTAADDDGTINSYLWEKISGPDVRMGYTDSASMELADVQEGIYVFRFTATDNEGASASVEKTVNVETIVSSLQPDFAAAIISSVAFPNPFEDQIHLVVESPQQEKMIVKLFDIQSKEIYSGSFISHQGVKVAHIINLPRELDGRAVYFIQLQNERGSFAKMIRMVKK